LWAGAGTYRGVGWVQVELGKGGVGYENLCAGY